MEFTLALLAVACLLMTLGMGVVTWRLLREERRRSAARIAALAAELDGYRAAPPPGPAPAAPRSVGAFGTSYGEMQAPSWLARAAGLAAAAGLLLTVVLIAVVGLRDADGGEAGTPSPAPLELLALEHEPVGSALAITGSVRATEASSPGALAVLATALDAGGAAVASSRADLRELVPGAVLPFAVEVPAAGVARYRISFLRDEAPVPHLDRRASARVDGAAAEAAAGAGGAS